MCFVVHLLSSPVPSPPMLLFGPLACCWPYLYMIEQRRSFVWGIASCITREKMVDDSCTCSTLEPLDRLCVCVCLGPARQKLIALQLASSFCAPMRPMIYLALSRYASLHVAMCWLERHTVALALCLCDIFILHILTHTHTERLFIITAATIAIIINIIITANNTNGTVLHYTQ